MTRNHDHDDRKVWMLMFSSKIRSFDLNVNVKDEDSKIEDDFSLGLLSDTDSDVDADADADALSALDSRYYLYCFSVETISLN